jgi:CRISPR/Cas system endoribonuclease Cas6 (RAMP superfamily)
MRVELFDGEGNKYTVAFEGQITREKAVRVLDLVELLGGGVGTNVNPGTNITVANNELSKYEKVFMLIQKSFPLVWFSSKDVQAAYEQEFKEPINLSTVATYFARLANRGLLLKEGSANRLKYKVAQNISQSLIRQKIS